MSDWNEWVGIAVSGGTLAATIVLACFTFVLARATKRLAEATSRPLVTATIQPNLWSAMHCDIVVANNGNAPAYDIALTITPEPEVDDQDIRTDKGLPLRNISILRPGQQMQSFLTGVEHVLGKEFRIDIEWKRNPPDSSTEGISYSHRLPGGMAWLGAQSPEIEIADQLKKLREDWQHVPRSRKLKVDVFDGTDRENERKAWEESRAEREARRAARREVGHC